MNTITVTTNRPTRTEPRQNAACTATRCLAVYVAVLMGIALLPQTADAAQAAGGNSWNTFQPDTQALGLRCISSNSNQYKAPGVSDADRIATYSMPFTKAGTYDLYVRMMPGTMYFSRAFGHDYQWQEVKNLKIPEGHYTWVNLSETFASKKSGDQTFAVDRPTTKVFGIASRTRGTRIDAFAFGLADKTFSDDQLGAAVGGSASQGLVGFQAESAAAFGSDTLTDAGQKLRAKYAAVRARSRTDIEKQLPQIDAAKQQAIRDALAAQKLAAVVYEKEHRSWRRGYLNSVTGLKSLQEKLEDAPGRLADAEMLLKNALAMPEDHEDKARAVEEAQKSLEKRKEDLEELPGKLAKAKGALESAKQREPELTKQVEAAAKAREHAKANTRQAFTDLGIDDLLASDSLDKQLATYKVISEATPFGLAAYADQGPEQQKVIELLLADPQLMIQMLVADGPVGNKYGPAVEIYQAIQKVSPGAKAGLFQKLALAVALEHAEPIKLESREADGEEPQYADPIQRYRSYEKACRGGELDDSFKGLGTWSLRMVVNGTEPDDISAWGRKMLCNYRPDLVTMNDYDWRYVRSVDTEINYTSTYQKLGWDRPDLQRYQNILANGGICGRRAHFGRFILRAFGIPTTARSQPGHAALVHWTPDGWVPCLGGGWGAGNRAIFDRYPTDLDFLASTQAREDSQAFMKVKRAQWIGSACGEDSQYGYHSNIRARDLDKFASQSVDEMEVPEFWHTAAQVTQNGIVEDREAEAREAVGEDLGESNEPELRNSIDKLEIPDSERKITVDSAGTIHIPAAACSEPTNNTDVIRFMPSNLGGMQLHYTRYGGADTFAYTFDAPRAGKYQLTARLVTPAPKQHLYLTVNNADERTNVALPYTIGMWDELEPVEIELAKGRNVLTFSRGHYYMRGVSIRDFKLAQVK